MPRFQIKFSTQLTLAVSLFFLSSCSYTDHLSKFDIFSPAAPPAVNDQMIQDDPDLALEPPETEICLTQELEALQKTGAWESHQVSTDEVDLQTEILYDFPIVHNKQVQMYLDLFQGKQRKQFVKWLARSGKYEKLFQKELDAANLPENLIYLSMIESGFNQRAYSRSRAVGLWQFMSPTGKQYGLQINRYIDERRDAEKSTRAAVNYLSDLYAEFNNWHLAVAAYNAGPGTIRKGLKKYKVDNFWDLAQHKYLRLETKRYVPKLIAAIIIAKNPEKYGFHNINYAKPLEYDVLEVGPGLTLDAVALISGHNVKTIKNLNIELKTSKTPLNRKSYQVKIPVGSKQYAQNNMDRLHSVVTTGYKIHIYKTGETLSAICRKYNINKTTLLKVNNLQSHTLTNGQRLRIPYTTVAYKLLPKGSKSALAAYKDSLILHKIRPGETISKISKKYNVPPELIVSWNGLQSVHRIRAGQQLALYIDKQGPTGTVADTSQPRTQDNVIVLAGSSKKRPASIGESKDRISWYKVKSGDSLWTISRKFNISPSQIKQWNNLKSNLIHPGIKLKLLNV